MTLIVAAFTFLFLSLILWRQIKYRVYVAALCVLQSLEERIDAHSEKRARKLSKSSE